MNIRHFLLFLVFPLSLSLAGDSLNSREAPLKSVESDSKLTHFVIIADGIAGPATEEYGVRPGAALFSMKVWAGSTKEAAHMARLFAEYAGFKIIGGIEVYTAGTITSLARKDPYGYAVKFYPYDPNRND